MICSLLIGWCGVRYFTHDNDHANVASSTEPPYVNICDWYGMLSPDLLKQFEKETGIKVQYDVFDNNEVLEAKLLASNSGYDVVFPTAAPYVSRQIGIGVYQPLKKEWLPLLVDLNPYIVRQMKQIDPHMDFVIPYYWGTYGLAFDRDQVQKCLPGVKIDSYDLIFNPDYLKKLHRCGVSFLEEAIDVLPLIQLYLKDSPSSTDPKVIDKAVQHMNRLRSFVRRFTSARFMNDLIMGDLCVAQAWSGEAHQARDEVKSMGRTIDYIIPKEGAILWIDCIAIPKGAPHPKNAHLFINFLLRPDIAAKITNRVKIPTLIEKSKPLVHEDIRWDPGIYPPDDVMEKLFMHTLDVTPEGLAFDKKRTRIWTNIRLRHG